MRRICSFCCVMFVIACESDPSVSNINDVQENDVDNVHVDNEVEEVSEDLGSQEPDIEEVAVEDVKIVPDECTKENQKSTCDDDVACTDDLCMNGVCQNLADVLACNDNNACTLDTCEKGVVINGGCHHKVRPCEDGNSCTLNACDIAIGCDHSKSDPMACAGLGDECSTAVCIAEQGCVLMTQNCDDGDIDTIDVCAKDIGCVNTVVECGNGFSQCAPSSPCVTASCKSGVCVEQIKVCDDDVNCTKDLCDNNGVCQHLPMSDLCPISNDVCVQSTCDVNFGCTLLGVLCDDGNVCTSDVCLEGQGCSAQKIQGCCLDSDDCQDGNSCTEDNCEIDGHCAYVAILCDDGLACTTDTCVPAGNNSYCNFTPDCDDKNLCTYDYCDFITGACEYKLSECGEGFVCESASGKCVLIDGACETQNDCDDDNQCTWDNCSNHTCENTPYEYPSWCKGATACETGTCNEGQCIITTDPLCIVCSVNEDCPSNLLCDGLKKSVEYLGSCDNQGTCEYVFQSCTSNPCESSQCVEGSGCHYEPKCNDDNPCTADPCDWSTGECAGSYKQCDDGNLCTVDVCEYVISGGVSCSFDTNTNCDDGDITTDDWCHYKEGCKHTSN